MYNIPDKLINILTFIIITYRLIRGQVMSDSSLYLPRENRSKHKFLFLSLNLDTRKLMIPYFEGGCEYVKKYCRNLS